VKPGGLLISPLRGTLGHKRWRSQQKGYFLNPPPFKGAFLGDLPQSPVFNTLSIGGDDSRRILGGFLKKKRGGAPQKIDRRGSYRVLRNIWAGDIYIDPS